jgi:hypothetical protein
LPGSVSSKSTCYNFVSRLEESEEEEEEEGGETEEKKDEEGGEKMEEGGAEKAADEEKGEKEKSGKTNIRSRKVICSNRIIAASAFNYVDSV